MANAIAYIKEQIVASEGIRQKYADLVVKAIREDNQKDREDARFFECLYGTRVDTLQEVLSLLERSEG